MNEPRIHELKCWPTFFAAIVRGDKPFELRRNDRDFGEGDWLLLREWEPAKRSGNAAWDHYTTQAIWARVSYVLHGGRFGLDAGYAVLGIADVSDVFVCYPLHEEQAIADKRRTLSVQADSE